MSEASVRMPSHHAQGKEVDEGSASKEGEGHCVPQPPEVGGAGGGKSFWLQRSVFVGLVETDPLWLYFKPTESN